MRDDVGLPCVRLIAVSVIVVKMRIDDIPYRLGGDELEIFHECTRGGRRRAGVHDEHVAIPDDGHVVAARHHRACRGRVVDAFSNLFEVVCLAAGDRIWRLQEHREQQTECFHVASEGRNSTRSAASRSAVARKPM